MGITAAGGARRSVVHGSAGDCGIFCLLHRRRSDSDRNRASVLHLAARVHRASGESETLVSAGNGARSCFSRKGDCDAALRRRDLACGGGNSGKDSAAGGASAGGGGGPPRPAMGQLWHGLAHEIRRLHHRISIALESRRSRIEGRPGT